MPVSVDASRKSLRRTRKEGHVIVSQRVLVVDGVSDTGDVLKAVLEPRGWQVDRVRRMDQFGEAKLTDRPDVMIVDAEGIVRYVQVVAEQSREPDYDAVLRALAGIG